MAPRPCSKFCAIAAADRAAVYWYCHSLRFTLLPVACSLTSLVWQFGALRLLGYGLDPLAVLVPSWCSPSASRTACSRSTSSCARSRTASRFEACRASFSGLLMPGVLALVTAFVSFITLVLIPIPMVRELAITASLGVAFKIVTNLVMLPVAASYFEVSKAYADKAMVKRTRRLAAHAGAGGRAAQCGAVPGHGRVIFARPSAEPRPSVGTLQPARPNCARSPLQPRRGGDRRELRHRPRLADGGLRGVRRRGGGRPSCET
jgi:hypothetical protein